MRREINPTFMAFDHPEFADGFVYYAQTVLYGYKTRWLL